MQSPPKHPPDHPTPIERVDVRPTTISGQILIAAVQEYWFPVALFLVQVGVLAAFIVAVLGGHCRGDEPVPVPDPIRTPVVIRWPMTLPTIPAIIPVDPREPKPIDTLKADEFLVVESNVELFVRRFPEDIIDVEATEGPIRVRAQFAGGNGKVETREYRAAHVYFLTVAKSGVVGVDLVPSGTVLEASIARHVLTATGGTDPLPPPGPGPGPEPPKPISKNVSIAIVEDTMNRSPDTAIMLNCLVTASWANADSGNEWRLYDLTTGESKGKKAVVDSGNAPGVVIYSKDAARQKLYSGPIPATIEDLKAIVRRLTGG